jgi:superfamily II DNA/RNA helicase
LSDATLRGLEEGDGNNNKNKVAASSSAAGKKKNNASNKKQFLIMTDIQNACIPHALKGRDILGAARTGRLVLLMLDIQIV